MKADEMTGLGSENFRRTRKAVSARSIPWVSSMNTGESVLIKILNRQ
jgi:hypothetical protein